MRGFEGASVIACVGPGGVGKTTVAASLACAAASKGLRTMVLAVDPARRLADALGIDGGEDIVAVPGYAGLDAGLVGGGSSLHGLVEELVPEHAEAVLRNRLFRASAQSLARSHAYVAMGRLYQVVAEGNYDLVVVDTPPSDDTFRMLEAPRALAEFLEPGVLRWLSEDGASGWSRSIFLGGSRAVQRMLRRVVGDELGGELIEFVDLLSKLTGALRPRLQAVDQLLHDPSTQFAVVAQPSRRGAQEALGAALGVRSRGYRLRAVFANRAYELIDVDGEATRVKGAKDESAEGYASRVAARLGPHVSQPRVALRLLAELHRTREALCEDERVRGRACEAMVAALPASVPVWRLPAYASHLEPRQTLVELGAVLARDLW